MSQQPPQPPYGQQPPQPPYGQQPQYPYNQPPQQPQPGFYPPQQGFYPAPQPPRRRGLPRWAWFLIVPAGGIFALCIIAAVFTGVDIAANPGKYTATAQAKNGTIVPVAFVISPTSATSNTVVPSTSNVATNTVTPTSTSRSANTPAPTNTEGPTTTPLPPTPTPNVTLQAKASASAQAVASTQTASANATAVTGVTATAKVVAAAQQATAKANANSAATAKAGSQSTQGAIAKATADRQAFLDYARHNPPQGTFGASNGTLDVTIGSITYETDINGQEPGGGQKFVAMGIRIDNKSGDTQFVSPTEVTLVTLDGQAVPYDSATFAYSNPFKGGQVPSGSYAFGAIVFSVPNDAIPAKIIYKVTDFLSKDITVIIVNP